ncbi:hypothetical protein CMI37_34980 [Candidatus Pacearchaeota archaeon]|nr:hypothetical protein [Candidatus Pacearchaeota archaeon]
MTELNPPKELVGLDTAGTFGSSDARPDVIAGWEFKNSDIDTAEIAGLVPFVQLYGLYSEQEIQKLLTNDPDWSANAITAVFVGEEGDQSLNDVSAVNRGYMGMGMDVLGSVIRTIGDDQTDHITSQLRSKFIHINIQDETHREAEQYTPGILLATNKPQAGNEAYEYHPGTGTPRDSGGVGISDLQIETGTKEFMNRRYKMRLTVTDPQELNEEAEYLKLTSLQSQFLIIHGWASPNSLYGWPGEPPPTLESPSAEFPNGRLLVDLTQTNTAGAWGAAVVATTMFDFAFNEVGQLEANFTFMPREISFLATYRVPTVADIVKRFLGTGEKTTPSDPTRPDLAPNVFAGFSTAALPALGKNLADVIFDEQNGYINQSQTVTGLFDKIEDGVGINVTSVINNWAETDSEWSGNSASLHDKQKEREGRFRFPYAGPGIRTYSRERRQVPDPTRVLEADSDETPENPMALKPGYMWVTESKSKLAFYYLGWVLEAIRFSMYDLNQQKVRRGETPFNVRFKYMGVPPKSRSTFNLSFQDTLRSGLIPNVKNYVQEATKFIMSNCFPSYKPVNPMSYELNVWNNEINMRPMAQQDMGEIPTAEAYQIIGNYNEIKAAARQWFADNTGDNVESLNWDTAPKIDKLRYLSYVAELPRGNAGGVVPPDWRQTLSIDNNNYIRILHPRYEGQLLYTYVARTTEYESYDERVSVADDPDPKSSAGNIFGRYGCSRNRNDEGLKSQIKAAGYVPAFSYHKEADQYRYWMDRKLDLPWMTNANANPQIIEYWPVDQHGAKRPPGFSRKSDGKFIGDITFTDEYGLLMPAEMARYYSNDYLALQRKWYNMHVSFLAKEIQRIVGERIHEAISEGKTIEDIGPEPVDLFWLTGKKYFTPAYSGNYFNFHNNARPRPPFPGSLTYSFDEVKDRSGDILVRENAVLVSDIEDKIAEAKLEKERINIQNAANVELYGHGINSPMSAALGDIEINKAQDALNSIENSGSEQGVHQVENELLRLIRYNRGMAGEIDFWQSRIKKVLTELYNKDVINLTISDAFQTSELTLSGQLSPPAGALEEGFSPNNRHIITNTTDYNFSNLQSDGEGYYLLFNGVPEPAEGRDATDVYITFNQLLEAGVAFETFALAAREEVGIYIGRFVMTAYEDDIRPLTLENIDILGDIGITQQNIDDDVWPTGTYIEYLFMNEVEAEWRNRYFSGYSMYRYSAPGSGEHQALKSAAQNYYDFITKSRLNIKKYLAKIQQIQTESDNAQISLDHIDNIIDDLQSQLDNLNLTLRMISPQSQEMSPFHGSTMLDAPRRIPKGGGRFVQLNTVVAQQWEQRFQKREVFGANDIHNYGAPAGGVAYHDPALPVWGWSDAADASTIGKGTLSLEYMLAETLRVVESGGVPNFGADWDGPKEILNLTKLRETDTYAYPLPEYSGQTGDTFNVRGEKLNDNWYHDQPNCLVAVGLRWPSARSLSSIFWLDMFSRDVNLESVASAAEKEMGDYIIEQRSYISPIRVKHLCRAGMVDFDLIKQILGYKYGFTDIGYEYGENIKTIAGCWPMSTHMPFDNFERKDYNDDDRIIEPYYRVDKDLDFVEEAYRQSSEGMEPFEGRGKSEERYLHGLDPMQLLKVPNQACVFGPISDKNNILYPSSGGKRLSMNDHLPTITRTGAQQMVNQQSRAESNGGAAQGRTITFSNNPDWVGVPKKISATWSRYLNSGRPSYSSDYPFGLPPSLSGDAGNALPGYQKQPVASGLPNSSKVPNMEVSADEVAGDVFEGIAIGDGIDEYIGEYYGTHGGNSNLLLGIGIPNVWKLGSWQAGRDQGNGDNSWDIGAVGAPLIHNILRSLPEDFQSGFLSSTKDADENFGGGPPLNSGLVSFINEHLINLLHMGRRIGVGEENFNRADEVEPTEETVHNYYTGQIVNNSGQTTAKRKYRVRDVTYADCFNEFIQRTRNTADFSNQSIRNVAEIPIKREVVDNLLNRRNHNMSLLQLCQQIMSPSSIGLAGNVQIGVRNNNGIIEIFPASISYKGIVQDMFKNALDNDKYSDSSINHLSFDYKKRNSLIQTIDMSSKMDPAAFLTYQNSSDVLKGRDYNVLKLLSIDGVAAEMSEFLSAIPKADDDSGGTYSGIVNVGTDRKVRINKVAFENIPGSVIDSFIAQDPQRWAQITAMMQEQNNFTTELLAFYMRGVTLTIHGTTNLEPFNLINVKGVLPALEGIYIITNLTQRISPSDFQTIIEGKLLQRRRMGRRGESTPI